MIYTYYVIKLEVLWGLQILITEGSKLLSAQK